MRTGGWTTASLSRWRAVSERAQRSGVLPDRPPVGVRFLEHTADAAIEVRARSLEGCFARAAAGMFACFTAPIGVPTSMQTVEVDVEADNVGELLVAWLEELLYQSEVKGLALHEFKVTEVSKQRTKGSARGPLYGEGSQTTGPAVKAVTRHGFELRKSRGYWVARVLFDV